METKADEGSLSHAPRRRRQAHTCALLRPAPSEPPVVLAQVPASSRYRWRIARIADQQIRGGDMQLETWVEWAEPAVRQSPYVASVTRAQDDDPPFVSVVELTTGALVHVQWVRTSPPKPADPDNPVTGQPPAPVVVPDLATSGRLRTAGIEAHLAALLTNSSNDQVLDVTRYSTDPALGSSDQPYGVRVRFHDESVIYALFRHTLSRGQAPGQGTELKQREEV